MSDSRAHNRALTINFLRSTGLKPAICKPAKKDIDKQLTGRPSEFSNESLLEVIEHNNECNIGAYFYGRYVDIDVDCDSPILRLALDIFLPKSPYVWGRKSKPASHRVYMLDQEYDNELIARTIHTLKNDIKLDGVRYSVEVRGNKVISMIHTVLPGSIHEGTGELIEWESEFDASISSPTVNLGSLVRAIRIAVAATLLATVWSEGNRNYMALALAGYMWRLYNNSLRAAEITESDTTLDLMDHKSSHNFFTFVLQVAGDTDDSRLMNFDNTWKKMDRDPEFRATGGKRLSELIGEPSGKQVVKLMTRLLSDSPGMEELEQVYNDYRLWWGKGDIINLPQWRLENPHSIMNEKQVRTTLFRTKIELYDKKVPLDTILYKFDVIDPIYGITFDPSTTNEFVDSKFGTKLNEWRGWAVDPHPEPVSDEEMKPLTDYLFEVIASENINHYKWVAAWVADIFQRPSQRPGTALVLVGPTRTGKSMLGAEIIRPLLGRHSAQTNDINIITNEKNGFLSNKLFVQADEAIHIENNSNQVATGQRMKSLITDTTISIRRLYLEAQQEPNVIRFLFTSNNASKAVYVDPTDSDGRYSVLEVSSRRKGDIDYWNWFIRDWLPQNRSKMLRWFLDYPYDQKLIWQPIESDAKTRIKQESMPIEMQWILTRIQEGFPISYENHEYWFEAYPDFVEQKAKDNNYKLREEWPTWVVAGALIKDLIDYSNKHKRGLRGQAEKLIWDMIPKIGKTVKLGSMFTVDKFGNMQGPFRPRVHPMPTPQQILEHLRGKYGELVDDFLNKTDI